MLKHKIVEVGPVLILGEVRVDLCRVHVELFTVCEEMDFLEVAQFGLLMPWADDFNLLRGGLWPPIPDYSLTSQPRSTLPTMARSCREART